MEINIDANFTQNSANVKFLFLANFGITCADAGDRAKIAQQINH